MQTTLRVRRGQRRALMASRPNGRGQLLESRQRSLQTGSVLPSPSTHCRHLYSASVSRRLHTQRGVYLCWGSIHSCQHSFTLHISRPGSLLFFFFGAFFTVEFSAIRL